MSCGMGVYLSYRQGIVDCSEGVLGTGDPYKSVDFIFGIGGFFAFV